MGRDAARGQAALRGIRTAARRVLGRSHDGSAGRTGGRHDACAIIGPCGFTIELGELPRESLQGQATLITIGDADRREVGRSPVSLVVE